MSISTATASQYSGSHLLPRDFSKIYLSEKRIDMKFIRGQFSISEYAPLCVYFFSARFVMC